MTCFTICVTLFWLRSWVEKVDTQVVGIEVCWAVWYLFWQLMTPGPEVAHQESRSHMLWNVFWTHSNWTAMEMAVKARKQSVWNFFSLVSQVGTWNFSCGGRAQHYMEDEFQSLRAEIKKMQTLLKAAKPHGHQAATKTIVDTEIQNPPWALEVSWKGPDQVTKWQKNRNEKVFCAKLLWIATKMLWTFIWNSNLTDDWNLGVLNKSNTELRRTHEVNQPKRSEKWMQFTAPSNLHVFQSDGVQSHFMR